MIKAILAITLAVATGFCFYEGIIKPSVKLNNSIQSMYNKR